MLRLTRSQSSSLKSVVRAQLALWRAADRAESLLGVDIDTRSDELDSLCVVVTDASNISDADLITAFGLQETHSARPTQATEGDRRVR